MTEVNVTPAQPVQQQMPGTSEISDFLFGGINGDGVSPALQELRQAEISSAQPQQAPPAEPQRNPLLNNGDAQIPAAAPAAPKAEPAPVANPKSGNELVNDLNGDHPLAGPSGDKIVDSPLMSIAKKAAEPVQNPFEGVQGLERVNEYLSSKIPGIKDINELVNKYSETEKTVASLAEVQSQYEMLIGGIKNLHPDLIQAMTMYEQGEDFRSYLLGRPNIDFTKSANEIDAKELIKAYFPGEVTDADFEAGDKNSDDYDPNVERLLKTYEKSAVDRFNSEKAQFNEKTDQYLARNQEQKQKFTSSVKQSLSSIKSEFPDVPDTYVQSIEQKLLKDGIDSLFYDENGYLKADAAARFVRASDDGKDLLTQLQRIAYDNAKTDANLDIITRSQRTTPESGGMTQRQEVNEEKVKAFVNDLVGGVNDSRRY